ncbi:MAG: hypothetical protein IPP47_31765 [Bryobacterales bacterium]|nr:hypothetical protein [Bryobacterales bacterium]
MTFLGERTGGEVGGVSGVSEGHVWVIRHRALGRLRMPWWGRGGRGEPPCRGDG